jgi:L-histidine N-alpha-methyltransferase
MSESTDQAGVRLDVRLTPDRLQAVMRDDVRDGLTAAPKYLPPKYFYDACGSRLFERITRLPEYYITRSEQSILESAAGDIAARSGAATLVELGSGSSEKTRLLLDALVRAGSLRSYVPVDVSSSALESALAGLAPEYPDVDLYGIVDDFDGDLGALPTTGPTLVAFLGSTIGNLDSAQRKLFFSKIRAGLRAEDTLLLGTDLVKETDRLLSAYDDAAGITAAFNRNVLSVLNRELGADFDIGNFEHVASWDAARQRVEMRLRAANPATVHVAALDLSVGFAAGEDLRTEISAKFRPEQVRSELSAAGLAVIGWWTDPARDFALSLSAPA